MKNILVILDKPKHEQIALQRALELAEKTPLTLHLVSFVYEPLFSVPFLQGTSAGLIEQLQQDRQAWMEGLHQQYALPDNSLLESVWHHDIAAWTADFLDSKPFDLVIKTAQKQYGKGGFGSIDWRLIESAPAPLWLAVNTPWIKHERIVAAIDPALENPLHGELNRRLLVQADGLASTLGASLEVVACLPFGGAHETSAEFKQHLLALKGALAQVVTESGVECSQSHFVTGKPAAEVNRVVDRNKARLILVGRGVRKGAGRFLLGNTAERILGRSNTDVLIMP